MLHLVLPSRETLPFRQAMLADPLTMAYNAPWAPPDGCIPFPPEGWDDWLDFWVGHEPRRFCAFVATEENALVGEVCWNLYGRTIGVVIHAQERGKGYGKQALMLLIRRAFSHPEIPCLYNDFEATRLAALRMHQALGFQVSPPAEGLVTLALSRTHFEALEAETQKDAAAHGG